jgi:hypothetical protein
VLGGNCGAGRWHAARLDLLSAGDQFGGCEVEPGGQAAQAGAITPEWPQQARRGTKAPRRERRLGALERA